MKVKYKTICHYIILYCMLILCQSNLYEVYLKKNDTIIFGLLMVLVLITLRRSYKYTFYLLALLLCSVFAVRLISGGLGITTWFTWTNKILIATVAVFYCQDMFMERYCRIISFLAAVNMIMYVLWWSVPGILKTFLIQYNSTFTYNVWSSALQYNTYNYQNYGLLFSSFCENTNAVVRNIGIYTEPGVYQMVLNSAIFILLYNLDGDRFSVSERKKMLAVNIIALITTFSVSGYFGCIIIVGGLIFSKADKRIKRNIGVALLIFTIIVVIDTIKNGSESIFSKVILSKILNSSGQFDINAGTGIYRTRTVVAAISAMFTHPFGMGAGELQRIIANEGSGNVAGAVFTMGAMLGFFPFILVLLWLFVPIVKSSLSNIEKLSIILLYFNTAIAQSSAFYPPLIVFSLYYSQKRIGSISAYERRYSGE